MSVKLIFSAFMTLATAVPALACIEPPEDKHKREIGLIDTSLHTLKRPADVLAKAKKLRERAAADFAAGKFSQAEDERHTALILIGYKLEAAPEGLPVKGAPEGVPVACGGGGGAWVAPSE